jgi:hypothetical protein
VPRSLLQKNINLLAEFFEITPEKMGEAVHAFSEQLKTTPEMTTVRIAQALFAQTSLRLNDWNEAMAVLALPEPSFDQTHWETNDKDMVYAWHGMQPARNGKRLEKDQSAAANWYHLCRKPQAVMALHFQIGHTHLAVWRLAHMWEEQKRSAA